jgi:SOS-response transcriptional repressor LexA
VNVSATQAISKALRDLLDRDGIKRKDLVNRTKKPSATVSRHVNGKFLPSVDDRADYAAAFGMTPSEFEAYWKRKREEMESGSQVADVPPHPSGIRPGSLRDTVDVDHYHSVSAARRDERAGEQRERATVPAGHGRKTFVVTLDGDCMEPKYHDGARVIFSMDAVEREGIVSGKSYFLQFHDGSQSFKRVFLDPEDREELILRPDNPKYPERRVRRSDVAMIARAVEQLAPAD